MRKRNHIFKYILSLALVLGAFFVLGQHRVTAYADGAGGADRIYYFNMDANGTEGNMILVQSGDHWGLMDAGHRYGTTITDQGRTYSTSVNGLSSQIYCRNGKDVAQYMINVLGVTHLDFIIGTHAHSDHVGGIPEIASTTFTDPAGNPVRLIDGTTTYYYKQYEHISTLEDDLAGYSSNSWHNQAFANQARDAMSAAGATVVNLAAGTLVDGTKVGDVVTDAELANYTRYYEFTMNGMTFRMYNLDEQTFSGNENINSIVTVISKNGNTVVNLADINTNNGAIDKISAAIANDYQGGADIVVAGHHGYAGSNTKTMFDELSPCFVVVSNGQSDSWLYTDGDLAAAIPYAENLFQTVFYNTSVSYYGTVTDISGNEVYIYSLKSDGDLNDVADRMMRGSGKTGWAAWKDTDTTSIWSYLRNGKSVKNEWIQDGGKWYHFDKTGIMETGWYIDRDGVRYLDESGALITGWREIDGVWYYFESYHGYKICNNWQVINGKWYYFNEDGSMHTGWLEDGGGVRYLDENGTIITGWREIDGNRYYFESVHGYKASNSWQVIDGKWYYFDGDSKIHTGWLEDEGGVRYLDENGTITIGWREIDGVWYYFESYHGYKICNNWQVINGKWYYFNEDGSMHTGWLEDGGGVRYLDENGTIITGWREIDGNRYYFESNHGYKVCNNWQVINGKWYYFNEDGSMHTGWLEDGGGVRYLDENGVLITGWREIDGKWYYLESNHGYLKKLTGWQVINGKWYYFNEDGSMHTGWLEDGGGVRYLDENGTIITGWREIDGEWYYFESNKGYKQIVTGWQQINGKWYYFYDDGRMATDTWIGDWYVGSDGVWVEGAVPTRTAKAVTQADETDVSHNQTENTNGDSDDGTLILIDNDVKPDDADGDSDGLNDEADGSDDESDDKADEANDANYLNGMDDEDGEEIQEEKGTEEAA